MKRYTIDWSRFFKFEVSSKIFVKDLELKKTYLLDKNTKVIESVWEELGKKELTVSNQ